MRLQGVGLLWGVKGDALLSFAASTWGLILAKAVRSASCWGFVVGMLSWELLPLMCCPGYIG